MIVLGIEREALEDYLLRVLQAAIDLSLRPFDVCSGEELRNSRVFGFDLKCRFELVDRRGISLLQE